MKFQSLIDAFDHQVGRRSDAVALIARDRNNGQLIHTTWRDLASYVERSPRIRFSHPFVEVMSDNTHNQIVQILSLMRAGVTEVSIEPRATYVAMPNCDLPNSDLPNSDLPNSDLPNGDLPDGDLPDGDLPDGDLGTDASLVLFTSGTTGNPKGVVLTRDNLVGNAAAKLAAVPQSTDDIRLMVLSMSHAYARTCDFGTWLLSGCTLAVTSGSQGLAEMLRYVRPTLMNVVPSIAYQLLDEDLTNVGLDRLRLLGCGGAPISDDAFRQWKDRGVTVIQGYGLTESGPVICSATPDNATAGLVGDFVDGWEYEIRVGELFVRGPHVMQGYWGDPEATAEKIDSEGWLRTGDLVERDLATGQMRILGRADDVIVMDNGLKISPSPIEREIQLISGIDHAMLLWRGRLELWFDGDGDVSSVAVSLAQFPYCHNVVVRRFNPELSLTEGELTAKGTVRRSRVLSNRFSDASDPSVRSF